MKLDQTLQLNVLTMLLFADAPEAKHIRATLPMECWTTDPGVNALVSQTYEFIDTYDEPPGAMVYDLINTLQLSTDAKKLLTPIVQDCQQFYPKVKQEWVRHRLSEFHTGVVWEDALEKGVKLAQQGKYAELNQLMQTAQRKRLETFDPGYTLADVVQRALEERDNPQKRKKIILNIPAFDNRNICPKESGLFIFIAPAKRGKSWALAYVGKQAMAQGLRVVHISLEMDQQDMGVRYLQALTAFYSNNTVDRQFVRLEKDHKGNFVNHRLEGTKNLPHIHDENFLENLYTDFTGPRKWLSDNIRLKQFPTGSLTVMQLKAYLEQLKQTNFYPDVLIIDYIDLMHTQIGADSEANRSKNTQLYRDIRALMQEEQMIGVSATQGNRTGAQTETNSETTAGNYNRIAEVDCAVAINQKPAEKKAGLCRLTVTSGRTFEDGVTAVCEQDLSIGQFAIGSQDLNHNFEKQYKEILKTFTGEEAA